MATTKVTALTELTAVDKSDILMIVDDPSGSPESKKVTVQNIFKGMDQFIASDTDFNNNEVLSTGIALGYGLLFVGISTDSAVAVYRVEGSTLTAVSANSVFSTSKDTSSKYNVYYETDQYKVQNKVADNKNIKVKFLGV